MMGLNTAPRNRTMNLADPAAERGVLAGLCLHGSDAFFDVCDIITAKAFTIGSNQVIFACLEYLLKDKAIPKVDYPSILSSANAIGAANFFDKTEESKHLRAVMSMFVEPDTVRRLGAKVRKLEIARDLRNEMDGITRRLDQVTGDEPLENILGLAENPMFDFASRMSGANNSGPTLMGEGAAVYYQYLIDNPRQMMGIGTGFPLFDAALGGGLRANSVDLIGARQKTGKAMSLDSVLYTPTGSMLMGDVKVGDQICGPNGIVTVEEVFPQGDKDIYRVCFADGDTVECCKEHLWEVQRRKTKKYFVKSLEEIMNKMEDFAGCPRWSVRLPLPCQFYFQEIPIHPYLLGVIIGDGGLTGGSVAITNTDQELLQRVLECLEHPYGLRNCENSITYRITKGRGGSRPNIYKDKLRNLKLFGCGSHDKFIPDCYKYNTETIRWQLLCGLMDTDGTIGKKGTCSFSTVSSRLANDMKWLVQSLGGLCKIRPKISTCNGKKFSSFVCHIRLHDSRQCFTISRKKNRHHQRKKPPIHRRILRVEYVGKKPAQCITVSSSDGLYLTNNFVITHNSFVCDNVGLHIAGKLGIPVLNVDTEMSKEEHLIRVGACLAEIQSDSIEKGKLSLAEKAKLMVAADKLASFPYHYDCVIGVNFEDTLARMRRWVLRTVGLSENGKAKPCLIIYDYLKLLDAHGISSNMAEHQLLRLIASSLKNFMGRYGVSCLTFAQLNRDGIDYEDTRVIRASDGILDAITSFSIFKWKTDDERHESQGDLKKYTHKLIPVICRHGPALRDGDYINIQTDYSRAKIIEGPTKSQVNAGQFAKDKGFIVDEKKLEKLE